MKINNGDLTSYFYTLPLDGYISNQLLTLSWALQGQIKTERIQAQHLELKLIKLNRDKFDLTIFCVRLRETFELNSILPFLSNLY